MMLPAALALLSPPPGPRVLPTMLTTLSYSGIGLFNQPTYMKRMRVWERNSSDELFWSFLI
jgi:hypothetical protein